MPRVTHGLRRVYRPRQNLTCEEWCCEGPRIVADVRAVFYSVIGSLPRASGIGALQPMGDGAAKVL